MKRLMAKIAALLAVVCLGAFALWWSLQPRWPDFPESKTNEPQVIFDRGREYAHHVGDLVSVTMYVRQAPDTRLDLNNLEMTGDFEIAGKAEVSEKRYKDGSVCYRVRLKLQSFKVQQNLALSGKIGWASAEGAQEYQIPPTALYWSNTWDGREDLQEGDHLISPAYWYWSRFAVPAGIAFLFYVGALVWTLRMWWRKRLTRRLIIKEAQRRVDDILGQVKAGTCSALLHLELDGIFRDRFTVGPTPASQLEKGKFEEDLISFLVLNAPAIYADHRLKEEENTRLFELGSKLAAKWK